MGYMPYVKKGATSEIEVVPVKLASGKKVKKLSPEEAMKAGADSASNSKVSAEGDMRNTK